MEKKRPKTPLFPKSPSLTPLRLPEEPVAPAPRARRRRAKGARKEEPLKEPPKAEIESEKEFDDSATAWPGLK